MVRFRTKTRVSEMVKVGPFHFKVKKPLGRGRVWGTAGTRPWRRTRVSFRAPAWRDPSPERPQAALAVTRASSGDGAPAGRPLHSSHGQVLRHPSGQPAASRDRS